MMTQFGILNMVTVPGYLYVKPEVFKDWFMQTCIELFLEKEEEQLEPMSCMITPNKIIEIYPDFNDESKKIRSINEMRRLAWLVNCQAYGFVSEAYRLKATEAEKRNYKIGDLSKNPESIEVLMCTIEIREGDKINLTHVMWDIIREKKLRLGTPIISDNFEGRIANILQ